MAVDIDAVRAANPIEDVVGETVQLRGGGRYMRGTADDNNSLVVDTHRQAYFWNSRGEQGDVISWVETHRVRGDFKAAVEWLCRRAGLAMPEWSGQDAKARIAARAKYDALTVACRHWINCLRQNETAQEYCRGRGWTDETVQAAGLGYTDGDAKALRGELSLHGVDLQGDVAKAVMGCPAGMLVYPHLRGGRVVYFSTRLASTEEKRHYNPLADLVGERQPFYNHTYSPRAEVVVVVEGQACAVTLAQWGMAGVALAGTSVGAPLLRTLNRHETVVVALDADAAGENALARLCDALGPLARVVTWPERDANDWLRAGATAADATALVDNSERWVLVQARGAGEAEGLHRDKALREFFALAARLDDFNVELLLKEQACAALRLGLREFRGMLKAARGEVKAGEGETPAVEIQLPGGRVGDYLLEMLVIPPEQDNGQQSWLNWRTRLAIRGEDGEIQVRDFVDVDGVRFRPLSASNRVLTERVVLWPDKVGEKKGLRELIAWIRKTIRKYVDIPIFYETLASYYVLFTWLYDCFNTVPYLRLLGDAGTGKSRFIQVVGAMCYRPIFVTGAATTSPIFRILDRYRGTLIMDEGDFSRSDEAADIIKILNTGYQRTQGVVLRSGDKNSGFEPEVFVVFGPKVLATRKRFADWALESRCLTHEAGGPTVRSDIPIDLPLDFWRIEALAIRNALLRYRMDNWKPEIELDYSQADMSVEPRLNQVTVALQTLIEDEELRGDLRAFIREYNRQLIAERGMTLTARVLESMLGLYEIDKAGGIAEPIVTMGRIAKGVNALIDSAKELDEADEEKGGKKLVTGHKVGHIVRKFLHMATERSSGSGRAYRVIWDQERVWALAKRFGLDEGEALEDIMQVLRGAGLGAQLKQGELT